MPGSRRPILEVYRPSLDEVTDLQQVRRLLDAARGRLKDTVPANPASIITDLEMYQDWMGGQRAKFEVARKPSTRVIEALAHTVQLSDSIEVNALSVAPESRKRGLGRRVLAEIIERAVQNDASSVWLHTHRANYRAQTVFAAAGFEPLPDTDFRQDPDSSYLAMELALNPDK